MILVLILNKKNQNGKINQIESLWLKDHQDFPSKYIIIHCLLKKNKLDKL